MIYKVKCCYYTEEVTAPSPEKAVHVSLRGRSIQEPTHFRVSCGEWFCTLYYTREDIAKMQR
jgi:hypothetical protein